MLSGETSIGEYPVEAVNTMSKIAEETERDIDYIKNFSGTSLAASRNVTNAISHATCHTAHSLGGSAIVTVTKSGRTAYMISKFRPACPILATTFSRKVFNQLSLTWGVFPILTDEKENTDEIFEQAIDRVSNTPIVKNGDLVVITGGMHVGVSGTTNTLKVHIIGDVLAEGKGVNKNRASGPLCVVHEGEESLMDFHTGDVLVIEKSNELILPAITSASAIITEEDSKESEAAVVGKALQIPVLTNVTSATEILKSGTIVTVDSSRGFVYAGIKKE
jgi:pyruvate kinase